MEVVARAAVIYVALFVIFRISGKRTLAQITTFDFILLLIVGEAVQQGLLGDDFSLTTAVVAVSTLVAIDILLSLVKQRFPQVDKVAEGLPVLIFEHGKPIDDRMRRARIEVADVLAAGREVHGVERLEQIKYAVLEQGGHISVIPYHDRA